MIWEKIINNMNSFFPKLLVSIISRKYLFETVEQLLDNTVSRRCIFKISKCGVICYAESEQQLVMSLLKRFNFSVTI